MRKRGSYNIIAVGLILTLSACEQAPNEAGPGGVSKEDAHALDAAAEKLDAEPQLPVIPVPPTQEAVGNKTKTANK